MLKNYLKIGWRNLVKYKFYSAVNVIGLFAGILFTLLIGAYVWRETQINRQLKNASRQYFLKSVWKDPNLGMELVTFGPIAKRLKNDYPNLVENYYRWDGITSVVSKGEKHFREGLQVGDSTMLAMYGFKLLHGDVRTALLNPFSTVITSEMARKYFDKTDVVGQLITIQSFSGTQHDFTVTGVLKDLPENSVTQINDANHNGFFIPLNTLTYFGRGDFENWGTGSIPSYIQLKPGVSAKALEKPIAKLIADNLPDIVKQNLTLVPTQLNEYYLERDNGLIRRMLYTLSFVGIFILLMAVVNFINIAISRSATRMREIGIRKLVGGLRRQLIMQFLVESLIIVTVATALALGAYPFLKDVFANVLGKDLPGLSAFPVSFVLLPIGLIAVIGLLAGLYPAFVLSSLKAVEAVKGKFRSVKENTWLRKSLVGFQFSIAIVVLIAAIIVSQQVAHFFSKGLGFNKEFVVAGQVPRDWSPAGVRKMETVRNEFARMPEVSDVSLSYETMNGMNGGSALMYKAGTDSTSAVNIGQLLTDDHYTDTYQIPLVAGSFFNSARGYDSSKIVLNEKAAQALGWNDANEAIGQRLRIPNAGIVFTVQGVTKDFHFGSMQQSISPLVFFHVRLGISYRFLSFRLKPGNISASIEAIQRKWATLLPGTSFEYIFMDDALKKLYTTEIRLKRAAYVSTVLALVIVLLGVIGLISLSIQRRIKEVGIRKVLGASMPNLIGIFVKEFLVVMAAAAVVACPLAYLVMDKWLHNYAYRIDITSIPFVVAVTALGIITIVLIGLQTMKAALTNPVKNLRTE